MLFDVHRECVHCIVFSSPCPSTLLYIFSRTSFQSVQSSPITPSVVSLPSAFFVSKHSLQVGHKRDIVHLYKSCYRQFDKLIVYVLSWQQCALFGLTSASSYSGGNVFDSTTTATSSTTINVLGLEATTPASIILIFSLWQGSSTLNATDCSSNIRTRGRQPLVDELGGRLPQSITTTTSAKRIATSKSDITK